jgi:pyridoxamine 5'-phosphate oxidase
MALATERDGVPSVRMVLLKGVDPERAAFVWYTSLDSRKAQEAARTEHAALCWWWPGAPGRQVRAVGRVELVERDIVVRYAATRPAAARIAAAASRQSRAVASRAVLDARIATGHDDATNAPERWGGLRLVATELEFWQGRPGRAHDRIVFLRVDADGVPLSRPAIDAAGGIDALRAAGTMVVDGSGTQWLRTRLEP